MMLRRHWGLAVAIVSQTAIWLTIPHPPIPTINAVSQIGDMRSILGVGTVFNDRLSAPWHPVASFLSLPTLFGFDDPLIGGRLVWMILHLCLTVLLYYIARNLISKMAGWFALFATVFGAGYYQSSYGMSSEMCVFVFAVMPLAAYARLRTRSTTRLDFIALGICCGLAVLSHIEYGIVFPIYLVLYLYRDRQQASLRTLAMSALLASASFILLLIPQLLWVKASHGVYALMSPYDALAFGSGDHFVPEVLWQMRDAGHFGSPWASRKGTLVSISQRLSIIYSTLAWDIFYPHLLKLLFVGGVLHFVFKSAFKIREIRPEHAAIIAIAIIIPLLNVYAILTVGIANSPRRLWSSAPFVVLVAGLGFSLIIHWAMEWWDWLMSKITAQGKITKLIGSVAIIVLLVLIDRVTVRYLLTDDHRQTSREQALAVSELQGFFDTSEKKLQQVACPTVQVAFLIGTPYIPFPFNLPERESPELWIQSLQAWGADYVVFYPSIMQRLTETMRLEVERILTSRDALISKTDLWSLYRIAPLGSATYGVNDVSPRSEGWQNTQVVVCLSAI